MTDGLAALVKQLVLNTGRVTHIRPGAEISHDGFSPRCFACVEDLESALAALWQPIETAPWDRKIFVADGRRVMVAIHRTSGNGFPARWQGPSADDFTYGGPDCWMPLPSPSKSGVAPLAPQPHTEKKP